MVTMVSLASVRGRETINESWYFHKGDIKDAEKSTTDIAKWEHVNIPHCWNAEDSYKTKDYYRGAGWYRKNIVIPAKYEGKRLFIRFDGASLQSNVYVNGKHVGNHKGGYTAFCFDVTDYLLIGKKNVIAVRVDNSEQDIAPLSADFTFFGGIYRDVWLLSVDKVHFDMENMASPGVFIETPSVSEKEAMVLIRGVIQNKDKGNRKLKLSNIVLDNKGVTVSKEIISLNVKKGEKLAFSISAKSITNPNLWSPQSPYLYSVETSILDAKTNAVIDKVVNPLGFRWFSFDAITGFQLNDKPLKLNGVCRHQDQQYLGSALSDEQHRRDMQMIKNLGANFIRISHYPQDDAILEQCDRLGLIAWEEIPIVNYIAPNEDFAATCESQLQEMIRQHYNHPSIMMWGYMNEIMLGTLKKSEEPNYAFLKQQTTALAQRLKKVLHEEDKARVSVVAQHENVPAYDNLGLSSIANVMGWNLYQGWYGDTVYDFGKFMDRQHSLHPERPHIISEYGAGSDIRIHSLQPECFDFSIEYQQFYIEEMMKMINKRSYIAGSSLWNFIDFGSAVREESMPHINNKGITYANRKPKDVYYYYQSLWSDKPVLHIASRDWENRVGLLSKESEIVFQPVKIYSNLSDAELFLNGKSLGKKAMNNCNAVWNTPFNEGINTLTARAEKEGKTIEDVLRINFKSQPSDLSQLPPDFELGVNVGSTNYFTDEHSGFTWIPEKPYSKGSWGYIGGEIMRSAPNRLGIQSEIKGTFNQPLFQTMREGLEEFRFDVPDGNYELELSFADPTKTDVILYDIGAVQTNSAGNNAFTISINGKSLIENVDLKKEYGTLFAITKRYTISVTNGEGLSVRFIPVRGKTLLNAIKIRTLFNK